MWMRDCNPGPAQGRGYHRKRDFGNKGKDRDSYIDADGELEYNNDRRRAWDRGDASGRPGVVALPSTNPTFGPPQNDILLVFPTLRNVRLQICKYPLSALAFANISLSFVLHMLSSFVSSCVGAYPACLFTSIYSLCPVSHPRFPLISSPFSSSPCSRVSANCGSSRSL